jgi:hypothetical protein
LWSCHEALRFGRRPIQLEVLRLGWNPQNSQPVRVDDLFKQRELEKARMLESKPVEPTASPDVVPASAPVVPPPQ